MRTRNYFKYLLAAIVAIGTSVNVMADEATYKFNYESQTVELQTIKAPYGTSVTLNAPFKRASKTLFSWLNDNYKDRVYLDNNAEGSIDFTGFRYEVTAFTMYVMANPNISGNNLYTDVKNFYNDETAKQSNTFRIGFSQGNGLTFRENNFLDKNISTINGLGQLYLKGLSNNNHAFFRGANDASPTFKITYNRPVVSTRFVSGSNGSEIEGYISAHAGAFLENGQLAGGAYFKYTSDNIDILEFKNSKSGKMTFHKGGNASIRVSLIYGNKTIAHYDQTINLYNVTLDAQGGTGGSTTVIATLGGKLPSGLTAPVKSGYEFKGFYSSQNQEYAESMGQSYDGTQYYDKDMAPVNNWNLNYNASIYAHWKPIKYVLKLYAGSKSVIPTTSIGNGNHGFTVSEDRTTITMNVSVGENLGHFYNGEPKKPGFKFKGFYVGDKLVAKANGRDIVFTNDGGYINNSTWQYTDNLTLTAAWEPKYTFKDGIIDFGTETLEVGIDWQKGEVNDLLGAAEAESESGNVSKENPVMVFDIRKADYLDYSSKNGTPLMEALKDKEFISPNVLVYLGNGAYNVVDNEVTIDNKCTGLVVTDRIPMKIPYGFTAQKATYQRNKAQKGDENDAMWQQSKESVWGTLCLPYPITNNKEYNESGIDYKIRFYELYGTHDNYMQFREMAGNQKIEANTPVLYCRTAGVGSAVTIQESSSSGVEVPANIENGQYKVNSVLYSNELREEMKRNENAQRVVEEDWQFKGTLETKKFCTKAYSDLCIQKGAQAEFLAGAEVLDPDNEKIPYREIYYFKQDKFTHMTSGVTILPYRAYFDRKKIEESTDQIGESKVSSYSILVVDADGTTTDITNLIDNHEAKGNGKIYDLSGRRVKQPVKGSIYIVDGKKKMY